MADQEQGRSEPATPFKLAEARKQGQVARSAELSAFAVTAVLLGVLMVEGARGVTYVEELCSWLFQESGRISIEGPTGAAWLGELQRAVLAIVLPVGLIGMASAVLVSLLQNGPVLTLEPLKLKLERLNPIAGLKRVLGKRLLFETVKTLVKLGLFAAVLYTFFAGLWPLLPSVSTSDVPTQALWFVDQGRSLLWRLCAVMLVIGIIDLAYVRWQFGRQLMMSRRELKEEVKRREGDPQIRAKMRELQRENLKQARSLGRVSDADVLITNPEHLAIALKYVPGQMSAPYVLAKGADRWAEEMRRLAASHGIPRFERRALAQHLFRRAQLDRPVPPDSFVEVARVYAEVQAQRRRQTRHETHHETRHEPRYEVRQ